MASIVFVCPPVIITDKRGPVLTAQTTCRIAYIKPLSDTKSDTKYEIEIMDAPPISIDTKSSEFQ